MAVAPAIAANVPSGTVQRGVVPAVSLAVIVNGPAAVDDADAVGMPDRLGLGYALHGDGADGEGDRQHRHLRTSATNSGGARVAG
jgi:hypothetical protein